MSVFSEFEHLHEQIEKMWERFGTGMPGQPRYQPPTIEPPADVYQTADAVVVVVEIAGLRGQDIEVTINDGRLTLRGEKTDQHHHHHEHASEPVHDHRRERVYSQMEIARGPFERTLSLPAAVDADQLSVRYEDGLLQITLPRKQAAATHRIRVTVRDS